MNKENVIREKRTIEATKKNLMGPTGKFGVILQAYGSPIIRQGTGLCDASFLDDPFTEYNDFEYASTLSGQKGPIVNKNEIEMMTDDFSQIEGTLFDGLSRGMHLEIMYWINESKLQVSYKGEVVYCEIAGELSGYAPLEEWENLIEKLYVSAKKKSQEKKQLHNQEMALKNKEIKGDLLQRLRKRWGF